MSQNNDKEGDQTNWIREYMARVVELHYTCPIVHPPEVVFKRDEIGMVLSSADEQESELNDLRYTSYSKDWMDDYAHFVKTHSPNKAPSTVQEAKRIVNKFLGN